MTALAVPLIDRFGLPAFTIATAGGYRRTDRLGNKAGRPRDAGVESVELKLFAVD